MRIVGLTGGIGSGKTTVANFFEKLGVPVYYADNEAKKLMQSSKSLIEDIINLLGAESYQNGKMDRAYIADLVFQDKAKLEKLNALVHPEVESHFKKWLKTLNSNYAIQENALIFENNKESKYDAIITVTAPLKTRVKRVMERDKVTEKQVANRIDNQLDDAVKISNATFVIHNTDLKKCEDQVLEIHKQLSGLNP